MANKPRHSEETWAEVRADMEAGATISATATKYGMAVSSIHKRMTREKWKVIKTKPVPPPPPKRKAKPESESEKAKSDLSLSAKSLGDKGANAQAVITTPDGHRMTSRGKWLLPYVKPWKPGQSGNPAGVPKSAVEAKRMCQKLVPEAVERAAVMMRSPDAQISAVGTKFILDHGMPKKEIEPEKPRPVLDFQAMTLDELNALDVAMEALEKVQALALERGAQIAGEANKPPEQSESENQEDGHSLSLSPSGMPIPDDENEPPTIEGEVLGYSHVDDVEAGDDDTPPVLPQEREDRDDIEDEEPEPEIDDDDGIADW